MRAFPACALAIFATVAFVVTPATATDLGTYGGPGDASASEACPAGSYIIGYQSREGDLVDQITPVCAPFDPRTGTFGAAVQLAAHGGPGGQPGNALCSARRTGYMTGMTIAFSEDPYRVIGIYANCYSVAEKKPFAVCARPSGGRCTLFSPDDWYRNLQCPAGEAVVSISMRFGKFVDALGIQCAAGPVFDPGPVHAIGKAKPNADVAGSWKDSCFSGTLSGSILTARCRRINSKFSDTTLDLATCNDPVAAGNRDGTLICESGLKQPAQTAVAEPTGGGGGIGDDDDEGSTGGGAALPLGSSPAEAPAGGVGNFANFAGDWDIVTERGDHLALTFTQNGPGVSGTLRVGKIVMDIGGNIVGRQLKLGWDFIDPGKALYKGTGRLDLLDGDRKFTGQLVLSDGNPLTGGTWSGTRAGGESGGGVAAALPAGEEEQPSAPSKPQAPAAPAQPAGEQLTCSQRTLVKSGNNGPKVTLSFHNASGGARKLVWLDFDGKEVPYATIAPGDTVDQQTFASHVWELTEEGGGCTLLFRASSTSETVEVP